MSESSGALQLVLPGLLFYESIGLVDVLIGWKQNRRRPSWESVEICIEMLRVRDETKKMTSSHLTPITCGTGLDSSASYGESFIFGGTYFVGGVWVWGFLFVVPLIPDS